MVTRQHPDKPAPADWALRMDLLLDVELARAADAAALTRLADAMRKEPA